MLQPVRIVRQDSATYPIYVGADAVSSLLEVLAGIGSRSGLVALVDPTVTALHRETMTRALPPDMPKIELAVGEERKTLGSVETVLSRMLELGLKRDSLAIVIGGGVAGDVGGFAAAIYLRGIDWVNVPTTLLAQVDSSVGGKVGVNHARGKNLIGAFHPPRAILSDVSFLATLPEHELRSGLFESLKGGVIGDPSLFDLVANERRSILDRETDPLVEVVRRSVEVKAAIVEADARERDQRRLLNYGHTLGHALEAALDYRGLTHGDAIAWGMIGANAIARRRGLLREEDERRIRDAILAWQPSTLPSLPLDRALLALGHDKKFVRQRRVMVFARQIGRCEVFADVDESEIEWGFEAIREVAVG